MLIILPAYLIINFYYLDKDYFLCPIEYKRDMIIRSDSRGDGFFGAGRSGNRLHQGIDFLAQVGAPVLAARSGIVAVAKKTRGMGNFVVIKHRGRLTTIYGHLNEIYVAKNEFVRQGQAVGSVGKTGNANSRAILPHLHFEVRENNVPHNPLEYLE